MNRRYTVLRTKQDERKLQNFRCKHCGEGFNQDDWQRNCGAPAYRKAHRPPKHLPKIDSPEDRERFLRDFATLEKLRALLPG